MPLGNHLLREEEWQTVLRRVLDLVARDQLKVFHALSDSLGRDLYQETERVRQARLRHEAIEAMRAAAAHLQLPESQAPEIPEYKRAAKQTSLPMSFNAVYAAFENRWELACAYFRGERIPETAAQRAMRRSFLGQRTGALEAPLTGVRLFLEQEEASASTREMDYEAWAKEFNESRRLEGYGRVSENCAHIRSRLAIDWLRVLAVARGQQELAQAQREYLALSLSESGPLVGHYLASSILRVSPHARHAKRADYPAPVIKFSGKSWLWLKSDIERYKEGERDFKHNRGALQGEYLDSMRLGEKLGVSALTVRTRTEQEAWRRVPRPAGKAGTRLYWSRVEVERWFAEEPRRLGRVGSGRGGRPRTRAASFDGDA